MSFRTTRTILVVAVLAGIALAVLAPAASAQIWNKWGNATPNVTCNQSGHAPCGFCDALMVVANVVDFATKLALIITTAMFAYGGIRYMISAGSSSATGDAKKILTGAVVGLIITLCAWLIVNTILSFLSPGGKYSLTNPVQCVQ